MGLWIKEADLQLTLFGDKMTLLFIASTSILEKLKVNVTEIMSCDCEWI